MSLDLHRTLSLTAILLGALCPTAFGQGPPELAVMQTGLSVASLPRDLGQPNTPTAAPGQYARPNIAAGRINSVPAVKPFQLAPQRPTISPYLNLYREERDDSLPNYFAFVLPQLRQQEFSYQQQLELARIQEQLQQASGRSMPSYRSDTGREVPNYQTRFLNTGHYFSGVKMPPTGGSEP